MANAYGNLRANNLRRHADTDADIPADGEAGGVTYGPRVDIGPQVEPQEAAGSTETADQAAPGARA